ncbi:hypothetical protein WR25_07272 [Diploscapter pachys]|uniref:C2H2-type domain-containing protein n=1 Tax=Diploscapter pachys TaxID=2018661 RepID=A0A2A2KXQ2_9BILA|nr:hypothetical protein WR25_07272 [Diploscapter pachys]
MVLQCPRCPITKIEAQQLKAHICEEHLDLQSWQCLVCQKKRSTKTSILEHYLAVHGQSDPEILFTSNLAKEEELKQLMRQAKGTSNSQGFLHSDIFSTLIKTLTSTRASGSNHNLQSASAKQSNSFVAPRVLSSSSATNTVNSGRLSRIDHFNNSRAKSTAPRKRKSDVTFASPPAVDTDEDDEDSLYSSLLASRIKKNSKKSPPPTPFVPRFSVRPQSGFQAKRSRALSVPAKSRTRSKSRAPRNNSSGTVNNLVCKRCEQSVAENNCKLHAYKHLLQEEHFAAYTCSDPFCGFESHSLPAANCHISKNHFGSINKVIVQDNITKDTEEKAEKMMELCFEGATNSSGNILSASDLKAMALKSKSTDRSKGKTIKKWCRMCKKAFTISRNEDMHSKMLDHLSKHISSTFGLNRFQCELCDFECVDMTQMQEHSKNEHEDDMHYKDNILDWTEMQVREFSKNCWGDEDTSLKLMPANWKQHMGVDVGDNTPSQSSAYTSNIPSSSLRIALANDNEKKNEPDNAANDIDIDMQIESP